MSTIATRAAVAAVLGVFCLGVGYPATTVAQNASPSSEMAMPAAKKPMRAARKHGPSKRVMALQKALNQQGAMLKVDGMMGRQTRAALKKYQAANKLKASGRLDKATRAKLKI